MTKIKSVTLNRRKKNIEIILSDKRTLELPFAKLSPKFNEDTVSEIYVDKELGNKGITYITDGIEHSVPLDAFLDYNRDPNYLKEMMIYRLTLEAQEQVKKSGVSKNELIRRLQTSASQLARLLDTANQNKTVDQMLRLLAVLGCEVELKVRRAKFSA